MKTIFVTLHICLIGGDEVGFSSQGKISGRDQVLYLAPVNLRFPKLVGRNGYYSHAVWAPSTVTSNPFQVVLSLVSGGFLTHWHWWVFSWTLGGPSIDLWSSLSRQLSPLQYSILSARATWVSLGLSVPSPHFRSLPALPGFLPVM